MGASKTLLCVLFSIDIKVRAFYIFQGIFFLFCLSPEHSIHLLLLRHLCQISEPIVTTSQKVCRPLIPHDKMSYKVPGSPPILYESFYV